MTTSNAVRNVVPYAVEKLKPHPRQGLLFPEPSPEEVKELAADMAKNGQLQPVEILPDGTLIAGHKRTAAAKLLGWAVLDAWVRDDLAAEGEGAVERRLIEDNLTRRQLDPLALARCALRLKQLARTQAGTRLSDTEKGEVRDQIGARLNLSGRHVGRLLRVVEHAPVEVQHAVSTGQLSMSDAHAVAGLAKSEREKIAQQIRDGADPKKVVGGFVGKKDGKHKRVLDAKAAFFRSLRRGLADLDGRVSEVWWLNADERETLRQAMTTLKQLEKARHQPEELPLEELLGFIREHDGDDAGSTPQEAPTPTARRVRHPRKTNRRQNKACK
jgi:ParB/RepB/Spo0J family partition protein